MPVAELPDPKYTVSLPQGRVEGLRSGRLLVFRGVPYARAGRFEQPMPPAAWDGIRPAIEPGAVCPQLPSRFERVMGVPRARRRMSEDCLHAAVFTPGLAARRPVMVFLHGGANMTGGGEEAWYDASRLADDGDVVVVTVTCRLGAFGYLYLPDTGIENLGLQDQVAALQWVQDNIFRFGGDPDNVTVFGHSSGGQAIAAILALHGPRFFRRAIVQSAPLTIALTRQQAAGVRTAFLAALRADPREAPAAKLLEAQRRVLAASKLPVAFGPVGIDLRGNGKPLREPFDLLLGWAQDDASPFVALRRERPGRRYGSAVDHLLTKFQTARLFSGPGQSFARAWGARGARTSLYRFVWRPPGSPYGCTHGIELPLLFGDEESWREAPMLGSVPWPEIDAMGRQLRTAWAAFARSGEPPAAAEWIARPGAVSSPRPQSPGGVA
jgi:para-nitrobenzyl esterase